MADNVNITQGTGTSIATDEITTLNGGAVSATQAQRMKPGWGVDGTFNDITTANPLPTREPVKGSALGKGGTTSNAANTQIVAANASRTVIEISNASVSGIWLAFGTAAAQGQGTYLPPKATGYWPTTAAVNHIMETGGTAGGAIGYTEW